MRKGAQSQRLPRTPAPEKESNQIADWWPVYPAGTLHGPVYDDKGRRVKGDQPRPTGWLHVDGQVYDQHGQENWALRAS